MESAIQREEIAEWQAKLRIKEMKTEMQTEMQAEIKKMKTTR